MSTRKEKDRANPSSERRVSTRSDTIVLDIPPRYAPQGRSASPKHNPTRQTRLQSKSASPAKPMQEVEVKDEVPKDSPLPPKRKASQELGGGGDGGDENHEKAPPRDLHVRKKLAPKAIIQKPKGYTILADENDCAMFFYMAYHPQANLRAIEILEIHLDTTKLDDFTEYRLALALSALHPLQDGTNPHSLQAIKLVVKGSLLFTRFSYHLTSPAMSPLVGKRLTMLITGALTPKEEAALPYRINSTEKALSKALLGIRGVRQVAIKGKGIMEGNFAETIKATLVQPPGTKVVNIKDQELPASTYRLNREAEFQSGAYGPKARCPYPTRPVSSEYDFECLPERKRFLIDEKVELLGHFLGLPDSEAKAAAVVKSSVPLTRRTIPAFDVGPVTKARSQKRGRTTKKPEQKEVEDESEDEDDDESLGLHDMIRIKARKEYHEDVDFETTNTDVLPVVLTNKEGTVELGWKA